MKWFHAAASQSSLRPPPGKSGRKEARWPPHTACITSTLRFHPPPTHHHPPTQPPPSGQSSEMRGGKKKKTKKTTELGGAAGRSEAPRRAGCKIKLSSPGATTPGRLAGEREWIHSQPLTSSQAPIPSSNLQILSNQFLQGVKVRKRKTRVRGGGAGGLFFRPIRLLVWI